MPIANIVAKTLSGGLKMDADVIREMFEGLEKGWDVRTYSYKEDAKAESPADIAIYLEHLPPNLLAFDGKIKIWVVNQEFIYDKDIEQAAHVNVIWCKSRHAVRVVRELRGLGNKAKYIGFYTIFDMEETRDNPNEIEEAFDLHKAIIKPIKKYKLNKDDGMAIHLAGLSFLKGSYDTLNTWLKLGDKMKDVDLFLCIMDNEAIRKTEKEKVFRLWDRLPIKPVTDFRGIPLKGWRYKNVVLCDGRLDEETYRALVTKARWHIMPSKIEGFGHSLNVGRMTGSIVVTTDAPPMNELIKDDIGILVKYKGKAPVSKTIIDWIPREVKEYTYDVDPKDLAQKIIDMMDMPEAAIENMSNKAIARAKQERIDCIRNFRKMIKEVYEEYGMPNLTEQSAKEHIL